MKQTPHPVGGALRQLLDLVENNRDQRCREIIAEARREGARLVAEAHRLSRGRMADTVRQERAREQQDLRAARARQDAELRRQRLGSVGHLLADATPHLVTALQDRWQNPEQRRQWLALTAATARERLPGQAWEVSHPWDWDPAEWHQAVVGAELGEVQFMGDKAITAGVRICCRGTCVEGTLAGLTVDRQGIEALFLAILDAEGSAP